MSNYDGMVTRQRQWMLYFLAMLVLGAGFTPYTRIFLGLLLGSSISFYNLWLLQRKIRLFGEAAANQQSIVGIGTFSRLAAAAVAVLIALRFEEHFHMIGVVIGLGTSYILIMIEFAIRTFSKKNTPE